MLEVSKGFFEKLFQALDNHAQILREEEDGRYRPCWCSPRFAEMMEGTVDDVLRLDSDEMTQSVHPDDRARITEVFHQRWTPSGSNTLTVRKRTLAGRLIWLNVHYAFVEEGGVRYVYGQYVDITSIKEAERRAKALYELLLAEAEKGADESLAALRLNLTRGVIEAARGTELAGSGLGGRPVEAAVQHTLRLFPLDHDRRRFLARFSPEQLMASYRSGVSSLSDIFFMLRPDGRQCFVRYAATMLCDPSTGDVMACIAESDYNEQMVHDAILHKALIGQYDMIAYIMRGKYCVVIGDAAKSGKSRIFPKKKVGLYDDYIREQVAPVVDGAEEEKARLLASLDRQTIGDALLEEEPYAVTIPYDIDGEMFYKRFVFYLMDREAQFYLLLKSDITEMQREQLRRNEHLKHALEVSRQANVAKTAFLSNMSHEIRTPMNAILGLDCIALKEPNLAPRTREHLEKIGASAHHLLSLINDILDMSRIESGRMALKNEEFSFGGMLEQINTMINSQCQERGLQYECVILGHMDEYYIGDEMKLKQVLINILGNAVKFTPSGSVSFTVERVARYGGKSTIRFTIRDTGIGMEKEYLPKIFEVFSQENVAATNAYGGTGLGLAITKNIVTMMSGDIAVDSEKGAGTTFTVHVTLKNSGKAHDGGAVRLRPQDMSVLIIDDDPLACEHAKLVLEEIGVAAETCLDGETGLRMIRLRRARREAYSLILVDLRMPGQDGLEVTRRIRASIGDRSAIIILTAYTWDDVIDEAIEAGVDSFMAKPIFATSVMEEFQRAFARKNALPARRPRPVSLEGRRVLLAEDMIVNAEIMGELLRMRGIETEHAENGRRAVDMFAARPAGYYDAILMDVRMPVLDGLAAASAIRSLERPDAKVIPIVAMTANAFDEDVQRSLQAGMNAHLSKPVEPEHLYGTLAELIGESRKDGDEESDHTS